MTARASRAGTIAFALFAAAWLAGGATLAALGKPLEGPLFLLLIFGLALPGVALLVCRGLPLPPLAPEDSGAGAPGARRAREGWLLAALVGWVVLFLAAKGRLVAAFAPPGSDPRWIDTVELLLKLAVFVAVPLAAYRFALGRSPLLPKALGLGWPPGPPSDARTRNRSWLAFVVLGAAMVAIQLLIGHGARPFLDGSLAGRHWLVGLVLSFLWMSLEAGLVEETFFRILLQSRLAALTRSPAAGLFLAALVFGLAHAPGLWLRGAAALEGMTEPPSLALALAYSITTMGVAGLLFGVLWLRTRNWLLIVALHGLIDALSNAVDWMGRWGW
ncbi:MAG: CPBP family intramembrane glutamic endopeptidase [Thermoanaerobaculia bacterium]